MSSPGLRVQRFTLRFILFYTRAIRPPPQKNFKQKWSIDLFSVSAFQSKYYLRLESKHASFSPQQNSELSGCCRSPVERRSSPTGSIASTQSQSQLTPSRQLSDGERLKKVILELIDTERSYVKVCKHQLAIIRDCVTRNGFTRLLISPPWYWQIGHLATYG